MEGNRYLAARIGMNSLKLLLLLLTDFLPLLAQEVPLSLAEEAKLEIGDHVSSLFDVRRVYLTDLEQPKTLASVIDFANEDEGVKLRAEARVNPLASAMIMGNESTEGCGFCRTDITLGDSGNITSPNFPSPYPNDANCLWLLQTSDMSRLRLTCDVIHLASCGDLDKDSPQWKDYLVISPLWSFKKSWVYCGHAVTVSALKHTSVCDKMAVSFKTDDINSGQFAGFRCSYEAIE